MVLDNLLDDGQPEAGAGDRLVLGVARAVEPGEQLSLIVGRDTDTTVLAGDQDPAAADRDRPRAVLGFLTPREVFTKLLTDTVASTA